jgi:hypothetical protein
MSPAISMMIAKEVMQPLPPSVSLDRSADEALQVIQRENTEFLPVVAPDTGDFVGIVLRRALERGCEPMGHTPATCPLVTHLKTEVDVCLEDDAMEPLQSGAGEPGEIRAASREGRIRQRQRLPTVVVDQQNRPVGMIGRERSTVRE